MSGIARLLIESGYQVTGSDLVSNRLTTELGSLGARVATGHDLTLIDTTDIVVRSSAVPENDPELVAARAKGVPVLQRAEMLAELMTDFYRIAVAGSHGKTTTASMATTLLLKADQDPSYVIGGILNEQGVNAHLGLGNAIVVEADESDASFLKYEPDIAIITNIDSDHLLTFNNDLSELEEAFFQFMECVKPDGHIIVCIDDERLQRLAERSSRHVLTYSTTLESADYYAEDIKIKNCKSTFSVHRHEREPVQFEVSLPGRHNVENALSCLALADVLGYDDDILREALSHFKGVGRRFQLYGVRNHIVIDDYGHHPKEIEATLNAAKLNWPERKIAMIFQPHRYTRTQQLFEEFVEVLSKIDQLVILDMYAASEAPIKGADSDDLARVIMARTERPVYRLPDLAALQRHARSHFSDEEVIIMQGAGSIGQMVVPFVETLDDIS